MPEHTGFLTYLLARFPALRENAHNVGKTFIGGHEVDYRGLEPIFMSLLVILTLVWLAAEVRGTYRRLDESVIPEDKLTLRTFFEAFFGFFYDMAKDVMGPKNAKRYFPLIGGSAAFIFFSNSIALVPGFNPPTSNLNVTLGCALLVFLSFNIYGLKENGWDYVKHLAGPKWFLVPLVFPIELISTCIRPVTLSIRLMVNIAVDHLVATIFIGMVAVLVPVPLSFLAIIVIVVQTLVFCLLSCIYIGLATEHGDHGDGHHGPRSIDSTDLMIGFTILGPIGAVLAMGESSVARGIGMVASALSGLCLLGALFVAVTRSTRKDPEKDAHAAARH